MGQIIVVFRARAFAQDDDYMATALRMRDKAIAEYGCTEFLFANTPDGEEIALSYWPDEASILRWKQDPEHQAAQARISQGAKGQGRPAAMRLTHHEDALRVSPGQACHMIKNGLDIAGLDVAVALNIAAATHIASARP